MSPVIVFIKSHSVVIVLQPSPLLLAPAHSLEIFLFEGNCGNTVMKIKYSNCLLSLCEEPAHYNTFQKRLHYEI